MADYLCDYIFGIKSVISSKRPLARDYLYDYIFGIKSMGKTFCTTMIDYLCDCIFGIKSGRAQSMSLVYRLLM